MSSTELTTFRRCPKEWWYRYVLKREPTGPRAEALTKGTAAHTALGQYDKGETPNLALLPPDIRAVVKGYRVWYGSPDREFSCEALDVPFRVRLDSGVTIIGEFDAVGVSRVTGKKIIVERKTSSEDVSGGSAYWQKVAHLDGQVTTYLLASRKMGWEHTEVLYDVVRKPDLRRLEASKEIKLKKDGTPRARQRTHAETDDELELRCLEDILGRPDHYYRRATIVRLEHEHEAHVRDVNGTVHLMQAARQMGEHVPRNTDSCFKYGRPCDFYQVCALGVDVMNETFYRRRQPKKASERAVEKEAPERFAF